MTNTAATATDSPELAAALSYLRLVVAPHERAVARAHLRGKVIETAYTLGLPLTPFARTAPRKASR